MRHVPVDLAPVPSHLDPQPLAAISAYLHGVRDEATRRGYRFGGGKIDTAAGAAASVSATTGQRDYERQHLGAKLAWRSPDWHRRWQAVAVPQCHPPFALAPGPVQDWERP